MKYKLINKTTQEEHLCSKVVIDGFDYYIGDTPQKSYEGFYFLNDKLYHPSKYIWTDITKDE